MIDSKDISVLLFLPSLKRTGPINVALNICKNIKGVKFTILSLGDGELYDEFINCSSVNEINIKKNIFALYFLFKSRNKYKAYHSHCIIPDFLNLIFFRHENQVSTLHNFIDIDYFNESNWIKASIQSKLHRFSLKHIKNVISCSKSVMDYVYINYGLRTRFISNGVDLGSKSKKIYARKFLISSAFIKRKNIEVAIDGFVSAQLTDCLLTIIGDGPLFNEISCKYKKHINIIFKGQVHNPRMYLKDNDVFLSSSLAEGLPMALLESMSEGMTYIISDIQPHLEIHELDYNSGIVVSNTAKDFQKAIESLFDINIKSKKDSSYNIIIENFTAKKMASNYFGIYHNE